MPRIVVGVGHIARALTASISVPPSLLLRGVTRPPFVPRLLVGVGHACTFTYWFSVNPNPLLPYFSAYFSRLASNFGTSWHSKPALVGVGSNEPKPVTLMRGTDIGSSQHSPPAVIPERGQVTENSSEPPSNEGWAVFHEDEAGSNFAHDPRHVSPHPAALAVNAGALAGNADILAREATRNHVNNSAPRVSVKGPNVIPNRAGREKAVILSGGKNARGVWLPLNSADGAPPKELSPKYSSTSPGEESEFA